MFYNNLFPMNLFICLLILTNVHVIRSWDNDDLEIFDLVEEINKNFYELLGIPQDADVANVRKAFRNLSLILHPDKNPSPNADTQFRQLAAVYDILKEPNKRKKYDEVLKNGLPNWKSAVYYYRKARKMGFIEMSVILVTLISIGQYAVGWASYLEQKFNLESMRKAKEKKLRKIAKGKSTIPETEIWDEDIPKPSVLNTLPVQIPKLLWVTLINLPFMIKYSIKVVQEIIEENKKKEVVEEEDEASKKKEQDKEKPKRRKKVPFIPEERQYDENSCLLDPVEISKSPESEAPTVPVSGGFWSDDDLAELAHLTNKYPPGCANRWEKIANIMNRTVPEVTYMAVKIKDNPLLFIKQNEETPVLDETIKKVKTKKVAEEIKPNQWSQAQQKAFENALVKYPKGSVSDRWEKIAKCVPDKTKEDCIQRYKYLAEMVTKQKNKGPEETTSNQES